MTKLKDDLNFQNLLDRIKMSQHETVQLHEKKIINYDEFEFNEPVKIPALYFNKEYQKQNQGGCRKYLKTMGNQFFGETVKKQLVKD